MTGTGAHPGMRALVLITMLALAAPARAQTPPLAQDLYQNALQSIAEGRKHDASETLARVIEQEPLHAGAWLDLALIQCSLGNPVEAERLFQAIETRFAPPPGIIELIAAARVQGCSRWQALGQWSLSLARGIDQNVNQGASNPVYVVRNANGQESLPLLSDFLPKHDQYALVSAEYLRSVSPNGSVGFAQFQARRYDSLHPFDSAALFVGVETPWRFDRWALNTTGMLGFVSLGGALYQRQAQVQARVAPPIPLPGSAKFNLVAGLSHVNYAALNNFDANTLEVRAQLAYRNERYAASASLGYLDDRAAARRPGGDRHGWLGAIQARKRLAGALAGEAGYTRQTWLSRSAYAPGLIDEVRDQATQVVRGALIYSLSEKQTLQLELRQIRNRENISIFQYNNRQLQVSWQWLDP
jgi:hypothetical protein